MSDPLLLAAAPIPSSERVRPLPVRRPGAPRQSSCHRGHPLSGPNLIVCGRLRQCRTCKNDRARRGPRQHSPAGYRKSEPGRILARGPLDYDVPVKVRCSLCGGVYSRTLGELPACPHCGRIGEAAA